MDINEYAEKVVNNFITVITDYVFINIERNEDLLREYEENVKLNNKDDINKAIGKKVKELLKLENIDENGKPKSGLITKYTRHKIP